MVQSTSRGDEFPSLFHKVAIYIKYASENTIGLQQHKLFPKKIVCLQALLIIAFLTLTIALLLFLFCPNKIWGDAKTGKPELAASILVCLFADEQRKTLQT